MTDSLKAAFQAVADQFAAEFEGGTFDVEYTPVAPAKVKETFTHPQ